MVPAADLQSATAAAGSRANQDVTAKTSEVGSALNHTSSDGNELRLLRVQQRAMGERRLPGT